MRFLSTFSGVACAVVLQSAVLPAHAASINDHIQYLPDGANLAFLAQKVGASSPAVAYNSEQMALPASTQKVLTALAALLQLGPDYRFVTIPVIIEDA